MHNSGGTSNHHRRPPLSPEETVAGPSGSGLLLHGRRRRYRPVSLAQPHSRSQVWMKLSPEALIIFLPSFLIWYIYIWLSCTRSFYSPFIIWFSPTTPTKSGAVRRAASAGRITWWWGWGTSGSLGGSHRRPSGRWGDRFVVGSWWNSIVGGGHPQQPFGWFSSLFRFPLLPVIRLAISQHSGRHRHQVRLDYTQYIRPNVINSFIIFTLLFWVDVYLTQDRLHGHVDGHFVHVDVRPHFIVGPGFVSAGRFRRLPLLGNRRRRSSDTQHHRRSRHSLDRRPLRIFNQQMSLHLFPNVDVITLYYSMHNEKSKINLKIFYFQLLIEENWIK